MKKKQKKQLKEVENKKAITPKEEVQIYIATFGKNGREVEVPCVKEGNGYKSLLGEDIPEWAKIKEA